MEYIRIRHLEYTYEAHIKHQSVHPIGYSHGYSQALIMVTV